MLSKPLDSSDPLASDSWMAGVQVDTLHPAIFFLNLNKYMDLNLFDVLQ
jgi:hypothetical protein